LLWGGTKICLAKARGRVGGALGGQDVIRGNYTKATYDKVVGDVRPEAKKNRGRKGSVKYATDTDSAKVKRKALCLKELFYGQPPIGNHHYCFYERSWRRGEGGRSEKAKKGI